MKAHIALGANLGNGRTAIARALRLMQSIPGISIEKVSPLYRTQPVGGPKQSDFWNGAAELETRLAPADLLGCLLGVERRLGRVRRKKWGPRTIDIDLLTWGQRCLRRPGVIIPHPRYHRRRFVLVPLCDIAPRSRHPRLKLSNSALLRKLTPQGQRVTIDAQWNGTRFTPSKTKKRTKSRS